VVVLLARRRLLGATPGDRSLDRRSIRVVPLGDRSRTGCPDHVHRTISESFYVLEASIAIFDGETWLDTEPGDWGPGAAIVVPVSGWIRPPLRIPHIRSGGEMNMSFRPRSDARTGDGTRPPVA